MSNAFALTIALIKAAKEASRQLLLSRSFLNSFTPDTTIFMVLNFAQEIL